MNPSRTPTRASGPTSRSAHLSGALTKHRRSRTLIVAFAALALAGASCGSNATPDATGEDAVPSIAPEAESTTSTLTPTTAAPPAVEEPALAWRTVELVDASRPSVEILDADGNITFEGSDSRSIPTIVWYPGADGGGEDAPIADTSPRPLAIYLKGFGGRNGPGDALLVKLAEAGYIVAAPDIREVSDPVNYAPGYIEQAGDARFVIDALMDPDDGLADDVAALIDPGAIGLVAHSIGTTAAFELAYHDCCREDRVAAVVAFGANPNLGRDVDGLQFAGTPLLLVYGDSDQIAPAELGTQILDAAESPSHLLTLPGADHFDPIYGQTAMTDAVVVHFLDLHVAGTASRESFDDLIASLEPGMWQDSVG